jgi:hypothetical protein
MRLQAIGTPTVRQRQFAAVLSPRKRLDVARKIVGAKLRSLNLAPADARGFREEIGEARKIEDLYQIPETVTRRGFQNQWGSDSTWRTREIRHAGSITG